ncbi:hypothetical protein H4W33_005157 [Kibdelosporangium phytohabitans]|nr:hypothetical protein [Kibdelosporangium phytohabitans]
MPSGSDSADHEHEPQDQHQNRHRERHNNGHRAAVSTFFMAPRCRRRSCCTPSKPPHTTRHLRPSLPYCSLMLWAPALGAVDFTAPRGPSPAHARCFAAPLHRACPSLPAFRWTSFASLVPLDARPRRVSPHRSCSRHLWTGSMSLRDVLCGGAARRCPGLRGTRRPIPCPYSIGAFTRRSVPLFPALALVAFVPPCCPSLLGLHLRPRCSAALNPLVFIAPCSPSLPRAALSLAAVPA